MTTHLPVPDEEIAVPDIRIGAAPAHSLSELASQHGLALTRFAYLICGDRGRAEDLVQEVLLAMHRRFGPSMPVDNPLAYARRAIVNTNVSWSRRSTQREIPSERLPEPLAQPAADDDAQLWRLLDSLSRRQRTVLVLRYYLGYPDADIAELLGCRRATVRSLAARALTELRARISATDPGASS